MKACWWSRSSPTWACSRSSSTPASSPRTSTRLARLLGSDADVLPVLHLVLPVGISFYTFKAMSYAIDVYRGDARPMRRFTDYMCFEAFFPDLVAGPIIRYAALEEQMRRAPAHARQVRARRRLLRASAWPRRSCSPTPWGTSPTPRSPPGALHAHDAWFGLCRLRVPDLLRLLRLLGHGRAAWR